MGCMKAPWQRNFPSRTTVISGTPPKTEKILCAVDFSTTIDSAKGVIITAKKRTMAITSPTSLIQQRNRKKVPTALKPSPHKLKNRSGDSFARVPSIRLARAHQIKSLSNRVSIKSLLSLRLQTRHHPTISNIRRIWK